MSKKTKRTAKGKGATAKESKAIAQRMTATDAKPVSAKAKSGDGAAMVTVGPCKSVKTVVNAQELATMMGVTGKRLRGVLRDGKWLGNDGRYSHYAIDTSSKDGKALVQRLRAHFGVTA